MLTELKTRPTPHKFGALGNILGGTPCVAVNSTASVLSSFVLDILYT